MAHRRPNTLVAHAESSDGSGSTADLESHDSRLQSVSVTISQSV
jgi:hypothetical protein